MPIFQSLYTTDETQGIADAATTIAARMGQVKPLRTNKIGDDLFLSGGRSYRDDVVQIDAGLEELVISKIMPKGARQIVARFSTRQVNTLPGLLDVQPHIHSLALMLTMPQVITHAG